MKSLKDYMLKEDSVDAMKHDKFNDIFQALERLNSEYDELDSLDRDENSTGVGDLTDQLTTMRKHIQGLYMVLDRMDKVVPIDAQDRAGDEYRDTKRISDSVNEDVTKKYRGGEQKTIDSMINRMGLDRVQMMHDNDPKAFDKAIKIKSKSGHKFSEGKVQEAINQALIDQVVDQIIKDLDMGDQTAIEELLMSVPEDNLRGFLSDYGGNPSESKDLDNLKKLAGI